MMDKYLIQMGAINPNLSKPPSCQFEEWLNKRIADAVAADRKRRYATKRTKARKD